MTVTFVLDATNINSDIFGNKNVENAEPHFYKIRRRLHYFQILSFGKYDIYIDMFAIINSVWVLLT